jgi:hypothetical protein
VQTIGTDRLLVRSNLSSAEITQWLRDHDNHPWGVASVVTAFRAVSLVSLAKGKMGNWEYLDSKMAER